MSHNTTKVSGQKPNSSGEITVNLDNLSNVNIASVSNDQILQYDSSSSEWKNETFNTATASVQYIQIGRGESNAYSNSGLNSIIASDKFRLYDSSPTNTITGATITNYSSTNWIQYVTLPSGTYQMTAQTRVNFTASGYFAYRLVKDPTGTPTDIGPYAVIGDNSDNYAQGVSQTLQAHFTLTSSDNVGFQVHAVSNVDTVANQNNTVSEFSYLFIEKVS
jgi:hypothetical protein